MAKRLFAIVCLGLVWVTSGCGAGTWGTATGTVTVDGNNLKDGVITFLPVGEGATAYGQIKEGEFTLSTGQKTGLEVGKYKVTVSAMTIPEPGSGKEAKLLTPKKYARKETTDLEAEVKPGSNRFDFPLRSTP